MSRISALLALLWLLSCATSLAMSVKPASTDDLIRNSDLVVRTEVLDQRCEWRGEGAQRRIVTLVRFKVERILIGSAKSIIELEFLGGRIDGQAMVVSGQPVFQTGERDILFIKGNRKRVCPIEAVQYGRFWVVPTKDGIGEQIRRANGSALRDPEAEASPLEATQRIQSYPTGAPADGSLSRPVFEHWIQTRAAALRGATASVH